jgi:hypothetical protein
MPQHIFEPIHPNPYIAGNPIRTREMFFGRVDEFRFIARALEGGRKTALIVLFGERRSGKSSILYQILNGELGEAFLPIFVDMQIMAGITSDAEFFGRMIADACATLNKNGLSSEFYLSLLKETTSTNVFRKLLQDIKARFPQRAVLLLIDEYEILEAKIDEGCLSRNVLVFFAGLLETDLVSFVFTGSKSLEARDRMLWGEELFRKAMARKISFLTEDDTARLITQPLQNKVTFAPEVIKQIYVLAAGQPFYTQMICQNLVYHLNEVEKYLVESEDLQTVVDGVIENPPPQLLFNWSEHMPGRKLALALLAEFSEAPETFLSARDLCRGIKRHKLPLTLDINFLNTELASLFEDEYVLQRGRKHGFRLDLYRRWVRHDHSIWQVKKEIGAEELEKITGQSHIKKEKQKTVLRRLEHALAAVLLLLAIWAVRELFFERHKRVLTWANGKPYSVTVDDEPKGTATTFEYPLKLLKGERVIKATLLATSEVLIDTVEIKKDDQPVKFQFTEIPVFIITDAADIAIKLDGVKAELRAESSPDSGKHIFSATVGEHELFAYTDDDSLARKIMVQENMAPIYLDFDRVVMLTLQANSPFTCIFVEDGSSGRKDSLDSSGATSIAKRGVKKGAYRFAFANHRTGEPVVLSCRIGNDTTVAVQFDPNWKPPKPKPKPKREHEKPAATHLLKIRTDPSGAKVILNNGEITDTTFFAQNLEEKAYRIFLEKPGYDPVDTNIVLTGEATIVKNLNRQYGYLKILVNDQNGELVSDANVYVNGEFKLKTPSDQELHLPVDTYAIKIERKGLVTKDTSCVIAKNVHLQFHVILRRE